MRSHAGRASLSVGRLDGGAERTEFTNGATEKTETKRRRPDDLQPRKGATAGRRPAHGGRARRWAQTACRPHLFVPAAALAHHAALRRVAPWC